MCYSLNIYEIAFDGVLFYFLRNDWSASLAERSFSSPEQ
jgi:hypothetical protein